jgi:hypothetical protein
VWYVSFSRNDKDETCTLHHASAKNKEKTKSWVSDKETMEDCGIEEVRG